MKKTLCLLLAVLLVACSLPAIITSYAEDSVNLLADATNANGAVTWSSNKIDPRSSLIDSKAESVYGGYSWTFGLGYGEVAGSNYEYVNIKATDLKVGDNYEFSYIYQRDFIFAIDSIKNANDGSADFTEPATETVTDKARSYKVSTTFTVPSNGDYVIKLKINRDMRTADCKWDTVTLGDLSLVKTAEATNYLENATKANGDVSWTVNIDARGDSEQDNKSKSVNGGYSWTFGMGNVNVGLPTASSPAYIYIKAKGLTENTRYDFSFIYQKDFIIVLDSIKDKDGNPVQPETASQDVAISGGDRAHQVSTTFVAPTTGDYTITLMTNRDIRPSECHWDVVILSDLVLIKSTAASKVDAEVLVSGNGDATVSEKKPSVGSTVTYTATPWQDEEFLGWYNGEEKISDSLVYSFPIVEKTTLTAKFTSNNLNVLAGKKASDWNGWHWLKVEDSTETKNGGKGYLLKSVMWQSMYTTVTLKANTEYDFSFNWKGVANEKGPAFPAEIMVYPVNAANIEDRAGNWSDGGDGGMFQPSNATDLEQDGSYGSHDMALAGTWQNVNTTFTTTNETDYNVIVYFSIDSTKGTQPADQQVNVSDFVLKEKNPSVTPPPVNPPENPTISEKDASDWTGYEWSKIENSTESHKGGKGYLVKDAMHQSIYTKLNLKPNTEYKLSFSWKAVQNDVCPVYPAAIKVYAANAADIEDRVNNWSDGGNFTPKNATDLEQGGNYASEEIAKTYEWQSVSTGFTTTGETEYNFVILFKINGGANHQAVNVSDFVLEEVTKEIPSISEKDASEWSAYQWSSIENSDVSRYGGKGYLVKNAMYQNIYTSLTLKPNTKYTLSFEWKSVANDKGPAFPNDIFVVSKKDIDVEDKTKNWIESDFQGAMYDLEIGGKINAGDLAETLQWQNTTVTFNTKDDTEYTLLIHFQTSGNGAQEIYLSDFKLEDGGSSVPDENQDPDNLAANYTATSGNVTWTDNAGPHFADAISDIGGGYSWGFGIPNTNFEGGIGDQGEYWDPAYVNIKTDSLEANHKYEFSFIYQKDFVIVFDSVDSDAVYGEATDVKLLEGDRAHRVTVRFTTTKAGVHNIKLKMGKGMNNENCQWSHTVLCDLKLYDITNRVYGKVSTELGGTITGFDKAYCLKGDEITLTATPLSGNTFEGWFDAEGNKVSADAVYTFTAQSDFNLLAKFSGSNIPNGEWLSLNGMDGTFENGTMLGWKAEDRENGDDTSWAMFDRSTDYSYNGDYSLKMRARYRTSFFKFSNLKKSTNYFLSFYVNHPDLFIPQTSEDQEKSEYNNEAVVRWFGVTASVNGAALYSESGSQGAPAIKGGSGWYKVNIYFNTGDYTDVDWNLYYTNKDKCDIEFLYIDDVSLIEYTSNEFENGDFANGAASWRGDFTVEDGVGKGKSFYQNVNLGTQTLYTVTFKAKGKGVGGASLLTNKAFDVHSQISSQSAVEVNSNEWKTYSFDVYTGVNPDVSLFFKADEGEFMVDDVTITKAVERNGAIVEKVDFESERFALHEKSDVFEIYEGTAGDANVYSGTKSLRFNSANAEEGVSYIFTEGFLSTQVVSKLNYRLTLYYKTAKGNSVYLSPEFLPEDTVKTVYTAAGNGWTKVDFIFNKLSLSYIKTIIGNVLGKTTADFYVDDITLTIAPPMVTETNSANKYCEWPLNVLNNQGFEDKITNNDWANLPKTAEIRTDKGAAGDNYLRLKAGTRYILPVKVEASDNYYFAISTRLGKNSSGYVAVASDSEGKKLYTDIDGNPVSKITVDSAKWSRDAYLFSTGESGFIYLVFVVEKGYIDVDEVAVYKRQYGMEEDLNDHTKFVPYNYDNPDPSTVVLNGGDSTFEGNEITEESESPETGDNRTTPATVLVITTFAAMLLVATTKRTRKISKGGKA